MRRLVLLSLLLAPLAGPAAADEAIGAKIAEAAIAQTRATVVYDPSYVVIPYPGGDVPADRGVCTDVVIRALRAVGVDLQKLVHEDMKADFAAYPQLWGLKKPDRNIDHRRVPNLETYFTRLGVRRHPSRTPSSFRPGDVVTWNLRGDQGRLPHIGVVTARRVGDRPLVVHNIGAGPKLEDALFEWTMTGHFRPADRVADLASEAPRDPGRR
jgi:hypothetical protein